MYASVLFSLFQVCFLFLQGNLLNWNLCIPETFAQKQSEFFYLPCSLVKFRFRNGCIVAQRWMNKKRSSNGSVRYLHNNGFSSSDTHFQMEYHRILCLQPRFYYYVPTHAQWMEGVSLVYQCRVDFPECLQDDNAFPCVHYEITVIGMWTIHQVWCCLKLWNSKFERIKIAYLEVYDTILKT